MAWDYYRSDVTDGLWADGNFQSGAKPINGDDVIFPKEVQNAVVPAGEDQKGVKLGTFWIANGMRFGIGGSGAPLIIDATKVVHEGDGTLYLKSDNNDPGGANLTDDVIINSPNGTLAAHLDGEKMDKITVTAGAVTLAATLGTVALPSRVIVGNKTSAYKANVTVNSGLLASTGTLIQISGEVTASATVPIVYLLGGEYRQTDGDNMTIFCRGGTFFWNVSDYDGDLADAIYLLPGSILDCTETDYAKTITALYRWPGSIFKRDPDLVTVTTDYPIAGGGIIQGPDAD